MIALRRRIRQPACAMAPRTPPHAPSGRCARRPLGGEASRVADMTCGAARTPSRRPSSARCTKGGYFERSRPSTRSARYIGRTDRATQSRTWLQGTEETTTADLTAYPANGAAALRFPTRASDSLRRFSGAFRFSTAVACRSTAPGACRAAPNMEKQIHPLVLQPARD